MGAERRTILIVRFADEEIAADHLDDVEQVLVGPQITFSADVDGADIRVDVEADERVPFWWPDLVDLVLNED